MSAGETRPLIVTAELGAADFVWFDAQRRAHFPPERNVLGAHLTMFHAIPPSVEAELRDLLRTLANASAPRAQVTGLLNLGRGVAYRIESEGLAEIRAIIADRFHGMLSAQDSSGWRPHVTIQNKVDPSVARTLLADLQPEFRPRVIKLAGLGLHAYDGGPWEPLARFAFRS